MKYLFTIFISIMLLNCSGETGDGWDTFNPQLAMDDHIDKCENGDYQDSELEEIYREFYDRYTAVKLETMPDGKKYSTKVRIDEYEVLMNDCFTYIVYDEIYLSIDIPTNEYDEIKREPIDWYRAVKLKQCKSGERGENVMIREYKVTNGDSTSFNGFTETYIDDATECM